MSRGSTRAASAGRRRRRPFVVGFLLGTVLTVPVIFLGLLVPAVEVLLPVLTPGATLVRPLAPAMATWPGGASLIVASLANGLAVGAIAAGVAWVVARARRARADGARGGPGT